MQLGAGKVARTKVGVVGHVGQNHTKAFTARLQDFSLLVLYTSLGVMDICVCALGDLQHIKCKLP
jgi:hypothetical protein